MILEYCVAYPVIFDDRIIPQRPLNPQCPTLTSFITTLVKSFVVKLICYICTSKYQMASSALPSLAPSFVAKKSAILHDLSTPASSYEDASPKGSVDIAIVELIDGINKLDGFVTTSSCAGRISVFVEGKKKSEDRQDDEDPANDVEGRGQSSQDKETIAGTGGKGGGGKWLYVSHDPFTFEDGQDLTAALGMSRKGDEESTWEGQRLVRFKFEPMVSYFLCL